jgi:hypothetical protein
MLTAADARGLKEQLAAATRALRDAGRAATFQSKQLWSVAELTERYGLHVDRLREIGRGADLWPEAATKGIRFTRETVARLDEAVAVAVRAA